MGKQATRAHAATGASRNEQIVTPLGYACPTPTTSRKIAWEAERSEDSQGEAVFGRSSGAQTASLGSEVRISLAFSSFLAHFTELLAEFWG